MMVERRLDARRAVTCTQGAMGMSIESKMASGRNGKMARGIRRPRRRAINRHATNSIAIEINARRETGEHAIRATTIPAGADAIIRAVFGAVSAVADSVAA